LQPVHLEQFGPWTAAQGPNYGNAVL
jgi:hypothetical protein